MPINRETLALPPGLDGNAWWHLGHQRRMSTHRHDELEANLVLAGRATYLVAGRRCDLQPGSFLWLFPDQDHVLLNETDDFAMWIVVWRPALIARCSTTERYQTLHARDPQLQFRQLGTVVSRRLSQLLAEVAAATTDTDRANAALAYALLAGWAAYIDADDVETRALHPAVRSAVRLLRADPTELTLTDLADAVGLSPGRLSRVFKSETGTSLVRFKQAMQLERFHQLYDPARMKRLPAALAAGFGSYAQFYRVHKQITGNRPGAV